MKILVDMDGVLVDINSRWLDLYNRDYDDNLSIKDIKSFEIDKYVKPECGRKIFDYLRQDGFFYNLSPMPDAIYAMNELYERGYQLFICTATVMSSRTAAQDKIEWIKDNLPFLANYPINMIITHHKYMINGDILFDDSPVNLQAFPGKTCKMKYPHNMDVYSDYEVNDWIEFLSVIEQLECKESFNDMVRRNELARERKVYDY